MVVVGLTLHSFYGLVSSLICYEFNNFSMSHSSCVRWNCRCEIHITYWYPINLLYIELKHQADFDICWLVGEVLLGLSLDSFYGLVGSLICY